MKTEGQMHGVAERLDSLIREYADSYFRHNPVMASVLGVHTYDSELGDWSARGLEERVRFLRALKGRAKELLADHVEGASALPLSRRIDAQLLLNRIDLDILDVVRLRTYARMPSVYADNCLYGIFVLTARQFAPAEERARSIVSRLDRIPVFLHTAKANLDDPPEIFTRVAIEMAAGGAQFMDEAAAFVASSAPAYASKAAVSAGAAKEAFKKFVSYLQGEVLPRSRGDFAVGEELFDERLRLEHMLDMRASEIESTGRELVETIGREMRELASRIDGGADWRAIIASIKRKHPGASEIKEAYKREMQRARKFVEERELVTIPPGEILTIVDTPVFERSIIPYAAYLPPGPFEERQEGLFYVTPVDESGPQEQVEDQLQGHNYSSLAITALHEGYPGHHLQLVRANRNSSTIRKLTESSLFAEGWALYCEDMMYEQGFYPDAETRLCQLKDSLWRAARVVIDVSLHTGEMSFEEAVDFLLDQAMLERTNAVAEVKRYAMMPTQPLSYSIGKMEIERILGAARAAKPDLELRDFHDALLDSGTLPPSVVREEVLERLCPSHVT